jgi:hypothetical protein
VRNVGRVFLRQSLEIVEKFGEPRFVRLDRLHRQEKRSEILDALDLLPDTRASSQDEKAVALDA